MDPLSLTASIIAVIGAASATAQALEKLRSLRHAPQQILVVLNEVCRLACQDVIWQD